MYYNGKSDFYLKQYIIPISALVISVLCIFMGIYVYWASNSENATKQNLVATENTNNKNEQKQEEKTEIKDNKLYELPALEKSNLGKIIDIKNNGNIVFNYNNIDYELTLIGINTENATNLIDVLKNDLLNKDVSVAFDINKSNGENVYAYIYLNDKLYNENLIERGITALKTEKINTSYNSDLIQAQAYAKQLSNGIWAK